MSNFRKVGIFMKTFGQEVKNKPSFSSDKINKLRLDLIKEEFDEAVDDVTRASLSGMNSRTKKYCLLVRKFVWTVGTILVRKQICQGRFLGFHDIIHSGYCYQVHPSILQTFDD